MQIPRRFPDWQVPFAIAMLCALAAAWGDLGRELLRYDRMAIAGGEVWRFVTSHFVHLGYPHLGMNLLGLGVLWLLVGRRFGSRQWFLVAGICIAVIDAGFWWLDRDLAWYVGLSGLLHGLLAAGTIRGIRELPVESVLICVLLAAKISYEQIIGPLPGSEGAAGGAVVVNAHLYGAIGGVLSGIILYIMPAHSPPPYEERT
jgi:rhomboid family GlyGly-CTERM serine protease